MLLQHAARLAVSNASKAPHVLARTASRCFAAQCNTFRSPFNSTALPALQQTLSATAIVADAQHDSSNRFKHSVFGFAAAGGQAGLHNCFSGTLCC